MYLEYSFSSSTTGVGVGVGVKSLTKYTVLSPITFISSTLYSSLFLVSLFVVESYATRESSAICFCVSIFLAAASACLLV